MKTVVHTVDDARGWMVMRNASIKGRTGSSLQCSTSDASTDSQKINKKKGKKFGLISHKFHRRWFIHSFILSILKENSSEVTRQSLMFYDELKVLLFIPFFGNLKNPHQQQKEIFNSLASTRASFMTSEIVWRNVFFSFNWSWTFLIVIMSFNLKYIL